MGPDHMSDRIFGGRKPGRCCQEIFSLGRIHSRFPTGLMSRLSHVGGPSRVPLRSTAVPPGRGVVTHPLRLLPPKPWRRASRGRPSCIEAREGAAYLARRGSTPPSVDRRPLLIDSRRSREMPRELARHCVREATGAARRML